MAKSFMLKLEFHKIGLATLAIATCVILILLSMPVRETSQASSREKVLYEVHSLVTLIESNVGDPNLNIPRENLQGTNVLTALLNGRHLKTQDFPFEQVEFLQEKGATYVVIPGFKDAEITAQRTNREIFVEVRLTDLSTRSTLVVNNDNL